VRPEHKALKLQVQTLLVAVTESGIPGVLRTPEEAELRAAWLLADVSEGTAFEELVKSDSDGAWPAVETVNSESRLSRPKGFGAVVWRLEPGEIGVVPYGPEDCQEGWMLVKRLQ
jgi:hypothetical protein